MYSLFSFDFNIDLKENNEIQKQHKTEYIPVTSKVLHHPHGIKALYLALDHDESSETTF